MNKTSQSLFEQMRITDLEISSRKNLFSITPEDESALVNARPHIEPKINEIVEQYYQQQTSSPDVSLLIGDSDTLRQLHNSLTGYILDLFSGYYDMEYVNNRLRVGMVHKRIGIEPKLFLSSVQILRTLLNESIQESIPDEAECASITVALQKLLMFDVSLIFDTYIRSLVSEIEISRDKTERYAKELEEKVRKRTMQLEELSRTDPLTGLLNMRHFNETLTRELRAAQRRNEPVTLTYIDINDFKDINDSQGHQYGDEVLQLVAKALKTASRSEDYCFRYGGDEFCIILSNCTIDQAKNNYIDRVQEFLQRKENSPSLSIGHAQSNPNEFISPETMMSQADMNMYEMKKRSKAANKEVLQTAA